MNRETCYRMNNAKGVPVRAMLKLAMHRLRVARDTSNRELAYMQCRIIRKLWRHRHAVNMHVINFAGSKAS